jgi:hypothetical protein
MTQLNKKLHSLIRKFEKREKRGGLSYGIYDREVRKFIVLVLEEIRKNYEVDENYFEIVGVIEDFINQMHHSLSGAGFKVWTSIDFSKLEELNSGQRIKYERLKEIWDYYKHLNF